MQAHEHQVAADFCKLVATADLLEYLGLPKDVSPEDAIEALKKKRRRMQGMQNNPKFQVSVRFLIKQFRTLEAVLQEPKAHMEAMRKEREKEKLPLLELAIQCIMADGVISPKEESFARQSAISLGISEETYEEALREYADEANISLPGETHPQGPPIADGAEHTDDELGHDLTEERQEVRGAQGHGWWDATFTKLLLETIPGGPGDMIDIYCRTALTGQTILPLRPQLSYLGIDKNAERLEVARQLLPDLGSRIRLAQGAPQSLPIPDESVDFVVGIRALANLPDTAPVFEEAMRVLRPGGRVILAEPDGLAETFYFNGNLLAYNDAFARLCGLVDITMGGGPEHAADQGRPGLALGPHLPPRMEAVGFTEVSVSVHASNAMKARPFGRLANRLRKYPLALTRAAGLPDDHPALAAVTAQVEILEQHIPADAVGMTGYVLPMFLCVGVKD